MEGTNSLPPHHPCVCWSSSRAFAGAQYRAGVASGFLIKPWSAVASIYGYYMQLNDGFEADDKTAFSLSLLPVQASSPIPLNSSQCHMDLEDNSKCQEAKGQATKRGENISFILPELDVCTQLCLSFLSWAVSDPWGKTHRQRAQNSPESHNQGVTTAAQGIHYLSHWGVGQGLHLPSWGWEGG